MSMTISFRSFLTFIKKNLLELNLFKNGIQDELVIKNQRRSTRLYLFLLLTSIFITGVYYFVITYTETVVIKSPSFIRYSTESKKTSLQCLCTKIAVKYHEFIEIEPFYHELCYSDFISDEYINQLHYLYNEAWNNSISTDFHQIAVFQFKTLRTFCQLTQETIENNLKIFLQTDFIQTQLISEESLQIQTVSLLADFIDFIPKTFLETLLFIQNITAQSLFMTGGSVTSVSPRLKDIYRNTNEIVSFDGITYTFSDGSSCTCSSATSNSCMGLTTFKNNIVPGFMIGCYMLSALLKSTVEILYNQTLINNLTNSFDRFEKLNSSISNDTVEQLLGQMFISHWTNKTSFERYFNQCSPDSCQYTIIKYHDLLFIITSLIGLFGGLSSLFSIIAPIIIITMCPIIWKLINIQRVLNVHNVDNEINRISICDHIKNIVRRIKQNIIELNFFNSVPPSQDENILRQQRYMTRIYLILLFLSVIVIIIFTLITPQRMYFIIKSPSLNDFIQLHDKYSLTLNCPCSNTAIDKLFISDIKPEYHEVCSSHFVSSDWINLQFMQDPTTQLFTIDIRYQFQFYFQLLSTLCQMANQTIENSLKSFYRTKFITSQVLNPQLFQIQINQIIENFKRTVPESFQRILNLLKANFEINQFITPINSAFEYKITNIFSFYISIPGYDWQRKDNCLQSVDPSDIVCRCYSISLDQCYQNIVIIDNGTNDIIPGMFQTWFPLQSVLMSTLECFYNDICLSKIKQLINSTESSIAFKILNSSSLLISNNQYDTIDSLANNLFIQSWNNQSSFESYFNQCNPLTCQYNIQTRLNLIYIATRIIGLIGGINLVLCLLLPFIIKSTTKIRHYFLQLKRDNHITREETTFIRRLNLGFYNHLHTLFLSTKQSLVELNFFPTIPPSQDPKIIHRYRRLTRIYLILLSTGLFILILYGLLRHETNLVVIESPTVSKYRELFNEHPLTLKCPCSHTEIKYNKFISQNQPQYHEVCSSVFVSSEWLNKVKSSKGSSNTHYSSNIDYRDFLRIQFQTLMQLCTLSQDTLNTSLLTFSENEFLTSNMISYAEFDVRTKTIFEQFKTSVSMQFIETLKLIQLTNHGNQLATIFLSNWQFISKYPTYDLVTNGDQPLYVLTNPTKYSEDECSCDIRSNCSTLSYIVMWIYSIMFDQIMPGFRVGCLFLDSFLQSSLICLYNKTCLALMQANIYDTKPIKTNVLTYSSLLPPNTTIDTILSQLFVSQWFQKASFDLYFNECAPRSCQYSYSIKYSTVYVITLLIAVFGGLTNDYRKKNNTVAVSPQNLENTTINQDNNTIEQALFSRELIIESNVISVEQRNISQEKYINRSIIIVFGLLLISGTVATFIVLLMNQEKEEKFISTTAGTTLISSSSTSITEITTACYMALKYQSQIYSTDSNPKSVVTGDFNKDSFIDLAVTNFDSDTLSVLLGNGDGTFKNKQIYSTGNGSRPQEIKTADFNNDTFLDLVVTLSATNRIVIFFGSGTSNLFLSPPYSFPFYTYNQTLTVIEVGDMNQDGFVDLIVGRYSNSLFDNDKLSIFLNYGDGYQFDSAYSNTFWSYDNILAIVIGDFHHRGQNEISLCSNDSIVRTFAPYVYDDSFRYIMNRVLNIYGYPSMMINGRFNNDAFDDLAVFSSQENTLNLRLSLTSWLEYQQIYLTESHSTSIASINFNNDSIDDLAILTCNGTLTVFIGENIGLFGLNYLSFNLNISNNGECFHSLKVADLNQDGKDDLIFIDTKMNSVRVVLGSSCNE